MCPSSVVKAGLASMARDTEAYMTECAGGCCSDAVELVAGTSSAKKAAEDLFVDRTISFFKEVESDIILVGEFNGDSADPDVRTYSLPILRSLCGLQP